MFISFTKKVKYRNVSKVNCWLHTLYTSLFQHIYRNKLPDNPNIWYQLIATCNLVCRCRYTNSSPFVCLRRYKCELGLHPHYNGVSRYYLYFLVIHIYIHLWVCCKTLSRLSQVAHFKFIYWLVQENIDMTKRGKPCTIMLCFVVTDFSSTILFRESIFRDPCSLLYLNKAWVLI